VIDEVFGVLEACGRITAGSRTKSLILRPAILWYAYLMSAFGPALFLCALAFGWPVFGAAASRLVSARLAERAEWLHRLSPWLRDLGLPYLALVLGAVAARDLGLRGHTLLDLGLGLLIAAGSAALGWKLQPAKAWPIAAQDALDEVRWALYRALVWGWSGSLVIALAVALATALVERVLERAIKTGTLRLEPDDGAWLARTLTSTAMFAAGHNLWFNILARLAVPAGRDVSRLWRKLPAGPPGASRG